MPTTCEIEFANNLEKVFYGGQMLRGTVHLSLTETKKVRGVFIEITGGAHVHWTTGSGKNKKSHSGNEHYLSEKTFFLGGSQGEIQLTAGPYRFTFECHLPHQLPTSFEGGYGHIRYTARVVLDIPLWPDKEFEVPFTVIKPINLNDNSLLRHPVTATKNKTFHQCCLIFCCKSNPLEIIVHVSVGGYTPGQTINLQIDATNNSDQPIDYFTVQLIKHIVYRTHANSSDRKIETNVICEMETEIGCDLNCEENIMVNLIVPSISPTDDTTSNIIKVTYYIQVTGSVQGCHSNPKLVLPIIIGCIPILDYPSTSPTGTYQQMDSVPSAPQQQTPSAPMLDNGESLSGLPYPTTRTIPMPPYPTDNPPTYEEAIHFGKNNDEPAFKPKYPMFRRRTSYSN